MITVDRRTDLDDQPDAWPGRDCRALPLNKSAAGIVDDAMSAHHTFKVPDAVRDVLARSTITATSVKLPETRPSRSLSVWRERRI